MRHSAYGEAIFDDEDINRLQNTVNENVQNTLSDQIDAELRNIDNVESSNISTNEAAVQPMNEPENYGVQDDLLRPAKVNISTVKQLKKNNKKHTLQKENDIKSTDTEFQGICLLDLADDMNPKSPNTEEDIDIENVCRAEEKKTCNTDVETNLKSAWRKLWPYNESKDNNQEEDGDIDGAVNEITDICSKLPGFEECDKADAMEWLDVDSNDPGYLILTDAKIADMVLKEEDEDTETMGSDGDDTENETEETGSTHSEAFVAAEILMSCLEKQNESSPTQSMLLKRIKDLAAKKTNHYRSLKANH
ncbi:hypothetical protein RN001_009022 [Aquatica leii]|uniref:Uncharacterized protein n=1 Tax=Aquatica leii TaxID=1421715 RepID=A0AAN7P836_9COLE|nr:hypothetical protein RN001_009022 [Aquatica leii]